MINFEKNNQISKRKRKERKKIGTKRRRKKFKRFFLLEILPLSLIGKNKIKIFFKLQFLNATKSVEVFSFSFFRSRSFVLVFSPLSSASYTRWSISKNNQSRERRRERKRESNLKKDTNIWMRSPVIQLKGSECQLSFSINFKLTATYLLHRIPH